jgi:hypothetical protein
MMGQAHSRASSATSDEDMLDLDQSSPLSASDGIDTASETSTADPGEDYRWTKKKAWSQLEKEDEALQAEGSDDGGHMIGLFCTRPKRFNMPLNRVIEEHEGIEEEAGSGGGGAGRPGWSRYRPWGWRLDHDAMRIRSAR